MRELYAAMMREEWRIHSSLFPGSLFVLFPVMIFIFSVAGALLLPYVLAVIPAAWVILVAHYAFAFFGLNVGVFGLHGREIMNRRFGAASLIAYASRTLPVSDKGIFATFIAKDVTYYFLLFILPAALGLTVVAGWLGVLAMLTLTLAFLMGLSFMFFISTVHARSKALFIVIAAAILIVLAARPGMMVSFLPARVFAAPSVLLLAKSLAWIVVPSGIALLIPALEYTATARHYQNSLRDEPLARQLVRRDFIDLWRSKGGVARILFSLLVPLALIWMFIDWFVVFVPLISFMAMFAIFLGLFSTSIFTWITMYDTPSDYLFLPVPISEVVKAKMKTTLLINIISVAIFILAAIFRDGAFFPALLSFAGVFLFVLAATVYLTGLTPNVMFFNVKVFLAYLAVVVPACIVVLVLSVFPYTYLFYAPVLIAGAYILYRKTLKRWDTRDILSF